MVRVPGSSKLDPRIADLGGKLTGLIRTARHSCTPICVVENERYLAAVEGSRQAVQHRDFPCELVEIGVTSMPARTGL